MAEADSRGDEDNILAQLLPVTAGAVSSQGFVEEDEEEVKYSDTDEDLQPDDPPGRRRREPSQSGQAQEVRSPPGADQGPAQKKHAPISWHEWQGPGEHDTTAGSRAERATRENGSERRRRRDSADGGKHSDRDGREQRSSRRSPGKSGGVESSREWRQRILREAAAERGGDAAAETGGRRSSRERSRGRSERQPEPRSEDRHRSADNPRMGRSSKSQSRDADPEGAAKTGGRRGEVMNPRIGPAGPRELEETEEEAQLRRARKKKSMWDVDTPTPIDNGPRTKPLDARVPRQRSWTPPGPPQVPLPLPPAFEDHHSSMRRSRESMSPPPRRYVHLDYYPAPRGPPPRSPPYYYPLCDRGRRDSRDLPPPPGRETDWERTADMRHRPSSLEPRLHPPHYVERAPYGTSARERRLSPPPPRYYPRELPPARSSPRRRDSPRRRPRAASPRSASPAFLDSRLSLRPQRSAAERRRTPERDAEWHERSRRDSPSRLASRREPAERKPEPRDSPSRLAPRREAAERKPEPRAAAAQPSSRPVSSSKAPEVACRPKEDAHGDPKIADKDGSSRAGLGLSEHKAAAGTADKAPDASRGKSASREGGAEQAGVPSRADPARADDSKSEHRRNRGGQHAAQRSPSANVKADREAASRRDSGQESSGRKRHREADTGTAAQDDKKPRISTAPSGRASDAVADRRPGKESAATPSQQHPSQEDEHRSHDACKAASSAAAPREDREASRRKAQRIPAAGQSGNVEPVSQAGTWGRYSATVVGSASAAPGSAAPHDVQIKPPEEKVPDAGGKERGRNPSIQSPRDNKPKDGAASTRKGQEGDNRNQGKPSADRGSNDRDKHERESSKRVREELREDRGPSRANKRHSADSAAAIDRKASHVAKESAQKSTNGHGHAADRDVKSNGGTALPGPPPLPGSTLAHSAGSTVLKPSAVDEGCMEWFYLDPKGETQGPCSIADFKKWLGAMRVNANLRREYEEFLNCWVWRKGDKANRICLVRLLG
ncbi:hypothetical protein COCOBI_08-2390 [Coccomyxa sp. Obi]|nr:hypothetical protein COCOBI_08-2390 [Coccomyxa sp. Obi]